VYPGMEAGLDRGIVHGIPFISWNFVEIATFVQVDVSGVDM